LAGRCKRRKKKKKRGEPTEHPTGGEEARVGGARFPRIELQTQRDFKKIWGSRKRKRKEREQKQTKERDKRERGKRAGWLEP